MEKCYILVVVICKDGVINTETAVFSDHVSAKVRFLDELKYYSATAPKNTPIYDGWDHKINWFDVGETTENYWVRAELRENSINA